jgi:predicted flap endonuclease-1-like 5' DNA nuclease
MAELMAAYWIYLVLALIVGLLVAWWIFVANRKTTIARDKGLPAAARRNQALIDAPPAGAEAATVPMPTPEGLAGIGEAVSVSAQTASVRPDDLTRIKGVGPKVEKLLHGLGVTTFAQIAAWDDSEVDRIDAHLGSFAGRIRRDDWRAQANLLAAGDTAAYEAKFGKL